MLGAGLSVPAVWTRKEANEQRKSAVEPGGRRRMLMRTGSLSRFREPARNHDLSLRDLPACERGSDRRLVRLRARGLQLHPRRAHDLPVVGDGGTRFLQPLRNPIDLPAPGRSWFCRRYYRQPRRSGSDPAAGSHLGPKSAFLDRAGRRITGLHRTADKLRARLSSSFSVGRAGTPFFLSRAGRDTRPTSESLHEEAL
jgi:hypothetical protein